jgi:adenosylcobinamide-phosphate synthase
VYGGVVSERARLGWPDRPIEKDDIIHTVRLLYGVSYLVMGGLLCAACVWL